MLKPKLSRSVEEWTDDFVKSTSKRAKSTHMTDFSFTKIGIDTTAHVKFSHAIGRKSLHKFSESSLADFYGAEDCTFNADGGIELSFRSWDDVEADDNGRVVCILKKCRCSSAIRFA